MKFKELKAMGHEDLNSKLEDLRNNLIKQNAQIATGTAPKNSGQLRQIKKTIARILSITKDRKTNNE